MNLGFGILGLVKEVLWVLPPFSACSKALVVLTVKFGFPWGGSDLDFCKHPRGDGFFSFSFNRERGRLICHSSGVQGLRGSNQGGGNPPCGYTKSALRGRGWWWPFVPTKTFIDPIQSLCLTNLKGSVFLKE